MVKVVVSVTASESCMIISVPMMAVGMVDDDRESLVVLAAGRETAEAVECTSSASMGM